MTSMRRGVRRKSFFVSFHQNETVSSFLSGLTSFLAFLGALLVVLAFKCDAKVLLQVTRD